MKKRGFTLIELLAVIVILAIIALIATPIVVTLMDKSEAAAAERSAENYIKAVDIAIAAARLDGKVEDGEYAILANGNLCPINTTCTDATDIEIEMSGQKPSSGTIFIENGVATTDSTMQIGDYIVSYDTSKKAYVALKSSEEDEPTSEPIPEPELFADDDWSTIVANVKAGNLSKYNVGDTKCIALNGFTTTNDNGCSNREFLVRIANTSTPSECSTSGYSQTACGFVIEFEDIITTHNMNSTSTNEGGWEKSEMRTYVNDTILKSLPEDLQNVIIDTTVVSGHGYTSGKTNFVTTDKLYLLSTKEVYGKEGTSNVINRDTAEAETRQLDYYKNKGVTTSSYSAAIKKQNRAAVYWWLRSANSGTTNGFYNVGKTGDCIDRGASNAYGVAAAFRIG